jgi:hypothetical protein
MAQNSNKPTIIYSQNDSFGGYIHHFGFIKHTMNNLIMYVYGFNHISLFQVIFYSFVLRIAPGASTIKLFTAVIYRFFQEARVFVLGKTFYPRLMFVGEARSLPKSGAP